MALASGNKACVVVKLRKRDAMGSTVIPSMDILSEAKLNVL